VVGLVGVVLAFAINVVTGRPEALAVHPEYYGEMDFG